MVVKVTTIDNTAPSFIDCGSSPGIDKDNLTGLFYQKSQSGNDSPLPRRPKGVSKNRFRSQRSPFNFYRMGVVGYINPSLTYFVGSDPTPLRGTPHSCFGGIPSNKAQVIDDNDLNNLIAKLYAKVAGSDFNLAVTLGQASETLDGIANGAHRLYDFNRNLRHGNMLGAIKALGADPSRHPSPPLRVGHDITSTWLDYEYGWKPLLGDVYSSAQLLAQQLNFPQEKDFRVRKAYEASSSSSGSVSYPHYFAANRMQICARITEPLTVPQLTGLSDPLSIAWELMPYSFVFDWFIPVGSYLQARGAASALVGKFAITTYSIIDVHGIKDPSIKLDDSTYRFRKATVSRDVYNSLNGLVPLPKPIPFSKALSWERAVSAISLLFGLGERSIS